MHSGPVAVAGREPALLDAISQVIAATPDEEETSKPRKDAEVDGHMGQSMVAELAAAYGRLLAGL